jgi:hypothetical protein
MTTDEIARWVPLMRRWRVSEVARSPRGFLRAFARAGGDPDQLTPEWRDRRNAFVARHMAQVKLRREPLFHGGLPTRRHLALIAWAYSPRRAQLAGIDW